jgi:hypothetical protein
MKMYCRRGRVAASRVWKEQPDFGRLCAVAAVRAFNVPAGGGGRGFCVAAVRARRLVRTNKADRMPLSFRGAHAPAVQGADAACVV